MAKRSRHHWPQMSEDGRVLGGPAIANIYRQAPSDGFASRDSTERRLNEKMRRLVADLGYDEVVRRIRATDVAKTDEITKAWLVLRAGAAQAKTDTPAPHKEGTL